MGSRPTRGTDGLIWPLGLGAVVVVALVFRLAYLDLLRDFIGADEAVGALMALKIAHAQEFPLLLWEAHYAGTLTSYLGAFAFSFFDPTPWAFRLTALPLALVGIVAIAVAARALWGAGPGLVAGCCLAGGPPLLFAMSSQAIGGYPEILCFGGLTLWTGARLMQRAPRAGGSWEWAFLGAAGGFGTYSLAFVLPIFAGTVWALRRHRGGLTSREWSWLVLGFLLGFSPLIFYNIAAQGASAFRLAGRVFDLSRADLAQASSLSRLLIEKGFGYIVSLLGFPGTIWRNLPDFVGLPSWGRWGAAVLVAGVILVLRRRGSATDEAGGPNPSAGGLSGEAILGWSALATLLFLAVLRLDAPRHLFPFYLLASLAFGALWARLNGGGRLVAGGCLVLALIGDFQGIIHDARAPGPRLARLVGALETRGIRFVYTDYFIAYPLIFLSRETILASPAAGPVNVDRNRAYTEAVASSSRPAYLFLRNTEATAVFVREMRRVGNPFVHEFIDEFDLYVPDRHVRPSELVLLRRF